MTLLDAPQFDAARSKRNRLIIQLSVAAVFVLLVVYWLVASRPVDWPWNWQPLSLRTVDSQQIHGRA